jgi:diguanylate cyclase (GGDEF)-like protein/PAS domain S-box-containing protein
VRLSVQAVQENAGSADIAHVTLLRLSGRRWPAIAAASVLFGATFVLRAIADNPAWGLSYLYVLPIIILALDWGLRGGVLASLVAFSLYTAGSLLGDIGPPLAGYVPRAGTYLAVGALTGWMADRMRETGEQARRFFELSHDLCCTASFEGYFVRLNDSWEKTLGWSREELMARPFVEFVHPDDRARTAAEAADLLTREGSLSFTNRYLTKDGGFRWIEWMAHPDHDRGLIYAVARDMTERLAAERHLSEAEERWRRSFEDSGVGVALIGVDGEDAGRLLTVNEALCRLTGYERDELLEIGTFGELTHPDDLGLVSSGLDDLLSGTTDVFRHELRVVTKAGEPHWVDVTSSVVRDGEGRALYRLSQAQDIDARKRAELELEGERDFQRALLESLSAGVIACDADGEVVLVNRTIRDLYESAQRLVSSGGWATGFGLTRPDGAPLADADIPLVRAFGGEVVRDEEILVNPPGREPMHVRANGQPILSQDGTKLGAVMAMDDVTERTRAQEELQYLADHDALSGLFNRRRFEQELEAELAHAAGRGSSTALLVLDLDNFKSVNDELGHAAGDRVISEVGVALRGRLRSGDIIARLGGDEFGVLLRRVGEAEAGAVANGVIEAIAERLDTLSAGRLPGVGTSVGIASLERETHHSIDDWLTAADAAMYRAKAGGGSTALLA